MKEPRCGCYEARDGSVSRRRSRRVVEEKTPRHASREKENSRLLSPRDDATRHRRRVDVMPVPSRRPARGVGDARDVVQGLRRRPKVWSWPHEAAGPQFGRRGRRTVARRRARRPDGDASPTAAFPETRDRRWRAFDRRTAVERDASVGRTTHLREADLHGEGALLLFGGHGVWSVTGGIECLRARKWDRDRASSFRTPHNVA